MDSIPTFYTLQQKISNNLRDFQKNNCIKNEFINDLIKYLSYGNDNELISFISMTINMYKKEIGIIVNEINEEDKIKLIKNIKALFTVKNGKEDIYRSLIKFNFENLFENKKDNQPKIINNPPIEDIKKVKDGVNDLFDGIPDDVKRKIKPKKIEKYVTKIEQKINKIIKEINLKDSKRKIIDFIIEYVKNNKINEITFGISKREDISQEMKLKLITLICIFFPFFAKKYKEKILKDLEKYFSYDENNLHTNLLFHNHSEINNSYLTNHIKNKISNNYSDFYRFNSNYDIIERYKLIILSKEFNLNNKDFILKLSFYVYLNLINYQFLNCDILFFLPILFFIKQFYTNVYNCDLKDEKDFLKYNDETKKFYFNDIYPESNNKNIIIDNLFTEEEINIFKTTLSSIKKFFNIDEQRGVYLTDLQIPYINKLFSIHILDLALLKEKYIKSNIKEYKQNLIKLETEIYDEIINKNFKPENEVLKTLYINEGIKEKYEQFYNKFKKDCSSSVKLYPYGSITEFLSSEHSDLDMYLEIPRLVDNQNNSSLLLENIDKYLSKTFGQKYKLVISKRLCVYSFNYKDFDFDLCVTGFSPYLHSSIFRAYSLMDSRFPILVNLMKIIITQLDIKYINNKESNNCYLNSFCWVLLIVSYLQYIISPPILPKIFENSSSINKNILYPNYTKKKKNKHFDKEDFKNFIKTMKKECVKIPNGTLDDYLEIYKMKIKTINKLSISELLLGFLEFIIYFYKFDVMYNNFSFSGEGFMNMSNIKKDEKSEFYKYFENKYLKFNINQNERDGVFLFRDPFDSHYNPGQTLKSSHFPKMIEKLEFTYKTLLETGSIKELFSRLEQKKEK